MGSSRLFIAVITNAEQHERRQRIRHLWFNDAQDYPEIVCRFIAGGQTDPEPDMDVLPVEDSYEHLPSKVFGAIRHSLQWNFSYFYKVDDDTFVDLERLLDLNPAGPYTGYRIVNTSMPYAHGGPGYLLSRSACELLAGEADHQGTGDEDLAVGKRLTEAKILFRHEDRLHPWWNRRKIPGPGNAGISIHGLRTDRQAREVLKIRLGSGFTASL